MNEKDDAPFRRSIWERNSGYRIIQDKSLSEDEREAIIHLMEVNAAKLNVQPIAPAHLVHVAAAINNMPDGNSVTEKQIVAFLADLKKPEGSEGSGIRVLICMLAVVKSDSYAPIDRKIAAGLVSKEVISAFEESTLNGSDADSFAGVYVGKVLPAWRSALRTKTPREVDEHWGRAGNELIAQRKAEENE